MATTGKEVPTNQPTPLRNRLSYFDFQQPEEIPAKFQTSLTRSIYCPAESAPLLYHAEQMGQVLGRANINQIFLAALELWCESAEPLYLERLKADFVQQRDVLHNELIQRKAWSEADNLNAEIIKFEKCLNSIDGRLQEIHRKNPVGFLRDILVVMRRYVPRDELIKLLWDTT